MHQAAKSYRMAVRWKGLKAVSNLETAFLALLLQTKPAEGII